jgi:hypothetical protein
MDFAQKFLKLMTRYHPRAKSLNPQGRTLQLTNHWAIPTSLRQAIDTTFLTTTELFGSPLNCSMSGNIANCSTFLEEAVFGAILNSFLFRWTSSCIANPDYEPKNMPKAVLHALASSECNETPFLIVLILPIWDDTPWNSTSVRGHMTMTTLVHIPAGHIHALRAVTSTI